LSGHNLSFSTASNKVSLKTVIYFQKYKLFVNRYAVVCLNWCSVHLLPLWLRSVSLTVRGTFILLCSLCRGKKKELFFVILIGYHTSTHTRCVLSVKQETPNSVAATFYCIRSGLTSVDTFATKSCWNLPVWYILFSFLRITTWEHWIDFHEIWYLMLGSSSNVSHHILILTKIGQ
jgi:hypothetical protein